MIKKYTAALLIIFSQLIFLCGFSQSVKVPSGDQCKVDSLPLLAVKNATVEQMLNIPIADKLISYNLILMRGNELFGMEILESILRRAKIGDVLFFYDVVCLKGNKKEHVSDKFIVLQ